jgi:hypothetical protein
VSTVYIVIGCDVDPDRERLLDDIPAGRLAWRGAREGIPAVKNLVRGLTDSTGREPVFTWFFRADEQTQRLCGEYAWFVRAHQPLLQSLQGSGDELGWHAHFWRRDPETGPWLQELDDVDWQVDMLHRAHRDLATSFAGAPKSVRMGWGYHNNRTYAALENLGIVADLSATPGFRTITRKRPLKRENLFDWYCSPELPYRPSRVDYRRPALGQEDSHRLLEVPSFVSTSLVWGLVRGIQLARKTAAGAHIWEAVRRPTYYINFSGRPRLFAPLVTHLRKAVGRAGSGPLVVVTHSHADEFVPNRSRLYSLESVRTNLEALLRVCSEAHTRVEFVQARRVPALWPDQAVPDRQGPDQRLRP